jgi:hypothetical protein
MNAPYLDPGHGAVMEVELPTGSLTLDVKRSQLPVDELVGFAARANAKRGFLFVSKVLGKHWPVRPSVMADIHQRMARQVPAMPDGPIVFIAMAETAIGLGQGMFEAYQRLHPGREVLFLHTTRYQVGDLPLIEFEEAHSHAPRQFLHLPQGEAARRLFLEARSLVLVDDEASTGNTFVNLAAAVRALNPGIQSIHLATITNFMGDAASAALPERFGCAVSHGAILEGGFRFTVGQLRDAGTPGQLFQPQAERGAAAGFGRLGLASALGVPDDLVARLAARVAPAQKVLVLGTGEFMHPAFLLGRALQERGIDVRVQSTTRSPILNWGAIGHALTFPDNYGEGIANFVYNVAPGMYDHVYVCHETPANPALTGMASLLGAQLLHFKSEHHVEEHPVC